MKSEIFVIVDSASQVRPAHAVAESLAERIEACTVMVTVRGGNSISEAQLRDAGIADDVWDLDLESLSAQPRILAAAALVVFLTGSRMHRLHHLLERALTDAPGSRRPLFITGYNGVVYEKHLEGLLWRVGSDLICINSERDHSLFAAQLNELGVDPAPLCITGLPLAQPPFRLPTGARHPNRDKKEIIFATQAVVPRLKGERIAILEGLRDYAVANPTHVVRIKPRARPGEATFHEERHHYESLAQQLVPPLPSNIVFSYGPLGHYLETCDLLVTVSSTAVIEALACGVPAALLTDVGLKESLGNHFFVGSGLLTSLSYLAKGATPLLNSAWAEQNGLSEAHSLVALVDRASEMLDWQTTSGVRLPMRSRYYTAQVAPRMHWSALRVRPAPRRSLWKWLAKLFRNPRKFFADYRRKRVAKLK